MSPAGPRSNALRKRRAREMGRILKLVKTALRTTSELAQASLDFTVGAMLGATRATLGAGFAALRIAGGTTEVFDDSP